MALDALELTELNKLYVITLSVTDKSPTLGTKYKVLFEIPLIIFANNKWRRDGQWGTTALGTSLLGITSGYWTISDEPMWKNKYLLSLYEEEPPNAIANFFGSDWPSHMGMLSLVPKFPIPAGSAGDGFFKIKAPGTKANTERFYDFVWKVQERRF